MLGTSRLKRRASSLRSESVNSSVAPAGKRRPYELRCQPSFDKCADPSQGHPLGVAVRCRRVLLYELSGAAAVRGCAHSVFSRPLPKRSDRTRSIRRSADRSLRKEDSKMSDQGNPSTTVVLVHAAWADGSSWNK